MNYYTLDVFLLEFICYDDGCHLRKFAQHSTRKDVTPTAQKLSNIKIVIDKMHMEGHTDKWCMANCDPHLFMELDKVSLSLWIIKMQTIMRFCYIHTAPG